MPEIFSKDGNGNGRRQEAPGEPIARLEREVAARRAALKATIGVPMHPATVALLATPLPVPPSVPPRYLPRLSAVMAQVEEMIYEISLRKQELASRAAVLRAARRGWPAPSLLDRTT